MVCSYCGMAGHNIRTCPYRSDDYVIDGNIRNYESTFCYKLLTTICNIFDCIITGIDNIFIVFNNITTTTTTITTTTTTNNQNISISGRNPIPKCISNQIYENKKEQINCCICLSDTNKDNFNISNCGHYYCDGCYNDTRLNKCAVCRNINLVIKA